MAKYSNEQYLSEREYYRKEYSCSAKHFDNYISISAIILSIISLYLGVELSFKLYIFSLLTSICSFYFSIMAHEDMIEELDASFVSEEYESKEPRMSKITKHANIITLGIFTVATIYLIFSL